MSWTDWLPTGLTIVLLALATAADIRSRRIPNYLTVSGALLGLAIQASLGGWGGAQQALLGWVLGFGLLAAPCLLGWMGGGDVKLLAAVGAVHGPALVLSAGLYGMLAGGLLSIAVAVRARRATGAGPSRLATLPYGPALAVGTLLALAMR